MYLTFTLLALAILSLWMARYPRGGLLREHAWWLLGTASLGAALFSGVVEPVALVTIALWVTATGVFSRPHAGPLRLSVCATAIVILAACLMLHRAPGFNNPRVIDGVRFSAEALPFTLHLNYDKTLIGLFILGWCHPLITTASEWRRTLASTAPLAAGLIAIMMTLSVAAGYVRLDPKFPSETWLWLGVNLLFTCVAEEALFRGFVQAQLTRLWKNFQHGPAAALLLAAVLFGIAHAGGGVMYVALATVAGLGYGWIYQRTGHIEAAIVAHFTLNTVHFFAFTYPALQAG